MAGPIEAKIQWAEACFQTHGKEILEDPEIRTLMERLKQATKASYRVMTEAGIAAMCARCDRDEGGSCCGAGLEDKYDAALLLINRLMGVVLPTERHDPRSCFFLGPRGCRLVARHVICVNYLCKAVTQKADPEKLKILREREGFELTNLFTLHERLLARLRLLSELGSPVSQPS
jgi:hypothetical protein